MTSGGLAVVGTRDPGSVLTGQTAEKELGEQGGPGAGRRSRGRRRAGPGAGPAGWRGAAGLGRASAGGGAERGEQRGGRRGGGAWPQGRRAATSDSSSRAPMVP